MNDCTRPMDGLTKTTLRKRSDAKRIARQMPGGRGRAYRCPNCGHYHVTTQPKRKGQIMMDIEEPQPIPEGEKRRSTYRLHYEAGATVDVLAFTAREAAIIAGRGAPTRIDNLTAMGMVLDKPPVAMPPIEDES